MNKLDEKYLINITFNWKSVQKKLKEKIKIKEIEEKKERYLNCDFNKEKIFKYNINKEKEIKKDKFNLSNINSGIEFENYLKDVFEEIGYYVETTKISGDQGADLIITKGKSRTVVQAKFYSTPVGNKAVQEVVASMKIYNASNAMVVTNNYYTNSARELAKANGVSLWDKDILESIISTIV